MNIPESRCAAKFQELIEHLNPEELECHPDTVFGLWADFTLAYYNPAWVRFSTENSGSSELISQETLGLPVIDVVPETLRPFYKQLLSDCLASPIQTPLSHRYQCSSPELFREFAMTLYRLGDGEGILIVNALVIEESHHENPSEPFEQRYRDGDGLIHQCSHCRKVRPVGDTIERWEWVPEWVRQMPNNVSHGLCLPCFNHFYPEN